MLFPLSKMNIGQTAEICWLSDNRSITGRLLDLGFEPGTRVTCILKKCGDELSAFLIKGAVIALRREDADLVFIKENETEMEESYFQCIFVSALKIVLLPLTWVKALFSMH